MNSKERYEELSRDLDPAKLMDLARRESGLSDYGDEEDVKSRLGKLLDCRARDTNFHAEGLKECRQQILRDLINRLRFQDDLKRHPEILDEDVSDPFLILALPRSGTTKTHNLVGTDRSLLNTTMWQLMNPAPFPDAVPGQPDPRIAAVANADNLAEDRPEVQAAHHFAPDNYDEDWQLFDFTLNDWYENARNPSRLWHDWVLTRTEPSDLDNYRYVRSLFQYLQWQQGGRRGRRWFMVNNSNLGQLDEILEVFPKASLTHIHRDPAACVPSLAKILLEVWRMRVADVDPLFVGEMILAWTKNRMDKYLEARQRLGLDGRIFDVRYDQIKDDPLPVVREMYRRAGHDLTLEAEQSMRKWNDENIQHRHGKHIYTMDQFGLSEDKIEEAFGVYIRRFIRQ